MIHPESHNKSYKSGKTVKKRVTLSKPVRSQMLHLYTLLTPEQLEFVKGSTGEGLASVFTTEGKRSLEFIKRLNKAKQKCRKFVLTADLGRPCYVANKKLVWEQLSGEEKLYSAHVTFNKAEALQFYEGFDSPADKIRFFSAKFPKLTFTTKFL